MKKGTLSVLIMVLLFSFYFKNVSASEKCSQEGYSIFTMNGILNSKIDAIKNKDNLKNKFRTIYNNEPVVIDYLYNPSHLAGVGDLNDAIRQGLFDQKSDYDLVEMLNDASEKVKTRKVLLVAHSQGNFYANNFYDKIISQEGGVPNQSIGVYGVASPANRVAGGGKYLTSDTDNVIASIVARYIKILPPNVHIPLQADVDGDGHSFSNVYLKYQGDRIVSDIRSSLDKLKDNDEQKSEYPCISPQKLSMLHKMQGAVLFVADPAAIVIKIGLISTYEADKYIANGVRDVAVKIGDRINSLAETILNNSKDLASKNGAAVIFSDSGKTEDDDAGSSNTSNSFQSSPTMSETDKEMKTVAMSSLNPPSLAAENSDDPSLPIENNAPENNENTNHSHSSSASSPLDLGQNQNIHLDPDPQTENPVDNILPVISVIGDNPITVSLGSVYNDPGATALDDVDGVITVVTTGNVDTQTEGSHSITYTAKDLAGNTAVATRVVNVIVPIPEPPEPEPSDTNLLSSDLNDNGIADTDDNEVIISSNKTLPAGEYRFKSVIITNNATLTLEGDPFSSNSFKGVKITAVNLTIDSGSHISADQKGYGPDQGPGAAETMTIGASYGGTSFNSANDMKYGSATKPIDLGSGGGGLSYGGGAIRIIISNNFTNNGTVSSNGDVSSSGGSIYVTTNKMTGSGIFRANGGGLFFTNFFKSPGGGGRVALYYKTSSFNGIAEAKGGCGRYDGFSFSCGQNGTVGIFDETANDLHLTEDWQFRKSDSPFSFNEIFVQNKAKITGEKDTNISANKILIDENSSFTFSDGETVNIPTIVIDGRSTVILSGGEVINADVLHLTGNSTITVLPEHILSLIIPNIDIDSGSSISAIAQGYMDGPGAPSTNTAGASYGGTGAGSSPTSVYGSETEPVDFGSGGTDNFRGGGAIRLIAADTLSNKGVISANGDSNSSGGSIYVTAEHITGNGIFNANGGGIYASSIFFSPGGGGRVAIYYKISSFTGQATASGVNSFVGNSGAGTVKMVNTSVSVPSSSKQITAFNFSGLSPEVDGVINETAHTISVNVPFGTDVTSLVPAIAISEKASVIPNTNIAQNFTTPITYTVTAEDGSVQAYIATVTVATDPDLVIPPDSDPTPDPGTDTILPSITAYTFNGDSGDITINPLTSPLILVLSASENVNWLSIKIENQDNKSIYKIFQSGSGCIDGTNTCTKTWNGILSSGGLLESGTFRVKVHMKDIANNEYEEYLPSTIIVDIPVIPPLI